MSFRSTIWSNFVFKFIAHLIFQIIIMYQSINLNNEKINSLSKSTYLLFFTQLLLSVCFVYTNNIYIQFLIFSLLSFTFGLVFKNIKNIDKVLHETGMIFTLLFMTGLASVYLNIDLEFIGIYLFIGLLCMLIIRLLNFTSNANYKDIVSILIALFVIYDTNVIMKREYYGNFVQASFDLFIDFVNLISLNNDID